MTEIEPEAVKRFKDIAEAGAGDGRMFTLEDGREIIAYIERLEKRAPTAPSGDDVDRLVNQLKAEHHRNGGQGAYAWQSRELCGKAAAAIAAMRPASGEQYRHVKRGTVYTVIGEAELQAAFDNLVDGSALVLYRGEDGKVWAREEGEFNDGRFTALRQAGEG